MPPPTTPNCPTRTPPQPTLPTPPLRPSLNPPSNAPPPPPPPGAFGPLLFWGGSRVQKRGDGPPMVPIIRKPVKSKIGVQC